ncbi:rhomboid family intramembrane serine protease [Natronogracilivirgula saccharolytica]|uniref:Rhomboid family intramembrane serine protease n=2 Tax=Natronogracilivirga saccharolytica TaxID=2812953 RepID=A0A8J7RG03_9BACT|nr:rhomboid family intramembrane serine protease [Natronogracilivirga saccharolytica]
MTPGLANYVFGLGALWPLGHPNFMPWQFVSYMFLHGGFGHILFNLFALWMFGQSIENLWGTRRFVIYYFVTGVGAALLHMAVTAADVPMVGASGAVYGILLAFAMMFPNRPIMLIFLPIPIKAKYFVMIFGALELFNGVANLQTGIAHFAHLGGMVVGYLLIRLWGIKGNYE